MVCKGEHPIAAMWLGMTNSNCAISSQVLSDLSYNDEDKEKALKLLDNFVNNFAKWGSPVYKDLHICYS